MVKKTKNKKKLVKRKIAKKKTNTKKKIVKKKVRVIKKKRISKPSKPNIDLSKYSLNLKNALSDSLIISKKSIVEGEIKSLKTIVIFGEAHGSIKAKNVYVPKYAKVSGNIIAENIFIEGHCGSDIEVKNLCQIKSSAVIKGDIKYDDNISIDSGARILGKLIPKKKPLALPNYSKEKNPNISSPKVEPAINPINDFETINIKENKDDSFDKIIKKIFK